MKLDNAAVKKFVYPVALPWESVLTSEELLFWLLTPAFSVTCIGDIFRGGGGTPYNGLYGEAPPEKGTIFRLQVYKRVGKSVICRNVWFYNHRGNAVNKTSQKENLTSVFLRVILCFFAEPWTRPWRLNILALCREHPKRGQNPKCTPLSKTTSIPVCFIWESSPRGVDRLLPVIFERCKHSKQSIYLSQNVFLMLLALVWCQINPSFMTKSRVPS